MSHISPEYYTGKATCSLAGATCRLSRTAVIAELLLRFEIPPLELCVPELVEFWELLLLDACPLLPLWLELEGG